MINRFALISTCSTSKKILVFPPQIWQHIALASQWYASNSSDTLANSQVVRRQHHSGTPATTIYMKQTQSQQPATTLNVM